MAIFVAQVALGQSKVVVFDKVFEKGKFDEYHSKDGDIIKKGDSLVIGKGSNFDKFVHITQANIPMHASHTGKKVAVKNIEVIGRKNSGYSVFLTFKGFGLYPVYVNYEAAKEAGEISLVNGKLTKSEAIDELKKQKELLDLEIITQQKYDSIKKELEPIITN